MTVAQAERMGFGVALGAHALLILILWAGVLASSPSSIVEREPVEVQLVDEVGLTSGAPEISRADPAAKLSEVEGPPEPSPQADPEPVAQPTPQPKAPPVPRAMRRAQAKPAPAQKSARQKAQPKAATRSAGRLDGLLAGLSDAPSKSRSTAPKTAAITPAIQSSLAGAVRRQLKPHWNPPTGADVERLRTELRISLARDGSVIDVEFLRQSGLTESNRPQAARHREQAIKAVRLASPFELPSQYYDAWKVIGPLGFDARLAQ
jgi:outer membrane biosynthesis protein TonB